MAIAIGVSSKGTTTGATSVATGAIATQATGSCIVGAMVFQGTFSNYTDNKSNSPYVQVGSEQTVDTTNSAKLRMYHFPNAVGGAGHTTTAAVTTSQPITNMVAEITGAALSSVVGTSNGATDTTSPYGNLVSITPTAGNYLLLAAFGGNSGSNPATQAETQGFTILASTQETNGATLWTGCLAYKLVTADGVTAYTAQFTESGASQGGIILAAFKELVSASSGLGSQRGQGPGYGPSAKRILARSTRSFASAGLDVTVALTGSAVTYSAGTLVPSRTVALVGTQYAWSAGTLTPSNALALTGTAVAIASGTLIPSTTVPLTGALVTFSTDTISAATNGDVTLALTGSLIGYSTGALVPSSTVALTGSAEAYSTGTIAVNHAQALAGTAEAYSTGVLTPSTTVSVAGSLVSYSTGTLSAQAGGDITIALTGIDLAFQTGTLTATGADVASGVTPAGRGGQSGSNRRRYLVQIDGQDFTVTSELQAVELLQRARAVAERIVEKKAASVERRLRRRDAVPVVALEVPEITVPFELREATAPLIADIERLYAKSSIEMELRLLLEKQRADDEDDDEVLLLI